MDRQGISTIQFYGKREGIAPALRGRAGSDAARKAARTDPEHIFKLFHTQDQAFKYSDAHPQLQLHTWSYEIDGKGKRRFVTASFSSFWRVYRRCIRYSDRLHFYEVIRNGSACRLYFDLEYSKSENRDVNAAEMVRVLKATVAELCSQDVGAVVELDSTTDKKWSKHLIFPDVCFHDNIQAGEFARKVCAEMEAKRPGLLMVRNSDKQALPFVDLAVYTKNRCFRLAGSSKFGKSARLLPEHHDKEGRLSISEALFFSSLVCNVSRDSKLLGSPRPVQEGTILRRTYAPHGTVGSHRVLAEPNESNSGFQSMDEYVMSIVGPYGGGIYGITHLRGSGTLMYAIRGGYKYCARIGRHHKSNNVILIADVPTRKMYQKCFDPDCRDFCSAPWDIPAQVFEYKKTENANIDGENAGEEISDAELCRIMDELDSKTWAPKCGANQRIEAQAEELSDDILNAIMDCIETSLFGLDET